MTTGTTDYYIKTIVDQTEYTTLYYYKSGKPVKVPSSEVTDKLKIKKQPLVMKNGEVNGYGKEYKLYVKTKEECIDSVVSGTTNQVALDGNAKRNKRKRGRRGKRNL